MHDLQGAIERYGSFHEDLIIGIDQGPNDMVFTVQRRSMADKLEDQLPVRNATLTCRGVQKFEFNEKRVIIEHEGFSGESDVDIEIVDLVATVGPEIRIEIFWEGTIDGTFYRDAKFDIFVREVALVFSAVERR